jgi:hypothetical protein
MDEPMPAINVLSPSAPDLLRQMHNVLSAESGGNFNRICGEAHHGSVSDRHRRAAFHPKKKTFPIGRHGYILWQQQTDTEGAQWNFR